jgi:hypothetical protein
MHNFKYHSTEELELLIEGLKEEVARLKVWAEAEAWNVDSHHNKCLKIAEEMLRQAEDEVLERTLLG